MAMNIKKNYQTNLQCKNKRTKEKIPKQKLKRLSFTQLSDMPTFTINQTNKILPLTNQTYTPTSYTGEFFEKTSLKVSPKPKYKFSLCPNWNQIENPL